MLPAVVLAEVTRGGRRDAAVNRVVNAIQVLQPVDEAVARLAGRLLAATGQSETIDSLVVSSAVAAGATAVMHHDADDLPALCDAAGVRSWLVR